MMAEHKFLEAKQLAQAQLSTHEQVVRAELIPLYLDVLEKLNQPCPADLCVEMAKLTFERDTNEAEIWLGKINSHEQKKFSREIDVLKISIAEKKGRIEELYRLLSTYQLHLFEARIPARPEFTHELIQKYFQNDFHLGLQELALSLMLGDLEVAESLVKTLILTSMEKASAKGIREKMNAIREIIASQSEKKQLELYQNLCSFWVEGSFTKDNVKKLAELVIYFDDFKFQVLLLSLFEKLGLPEIAADYAATVRSNEGYDFVYLDKYFAALKPYFVRIQKADPEVPSKLGAQESFEVLKSHDELAPDEKTDPLSPEEAMLVSSLKFQEYTPYELLDLSVSFIQSELYEAAKVAAHKVLSLNDDEELILRASYLKITCLLHQRDYRAALDVSLDAAARSKNKEDILSFLYTQADAYLKLGQKRQAKSILEKILSIDESYRLTKQRLQRLNEV